MSKHIIKGLQVVSLFVVMFLFASCQDQDGVQPDNQISFLEDDAALFAEQSIADIEEHASLGRRGCYEILFPITIDFPGGASAEVNSYAEMFEVIRTWKLENQDVDERPMIALPFDVINHDGEVITIETVEMLIQLRRSCIKPDRPMDGNRCVGIVFPVTIVFPDDSTLEVGDKFELRDAIMAWKEDHPDSDERPTLQFPIEVELKGGKIITVESQEQLMQLRRKCRRDGHPGMGDHPSNGGHPGNGDHPGDGDFGACFSVVFPVTIVFPDGTTTEVSSPREIGKVAKEWKLAHPDSKERITLEFPVTVKFKDGTTQEVGSKEELAALKLECK